MHRVRLRMTTDQCCGVKEVGPNQLTGLVFLLLVGLASNVGAQTAASLPGVAASATAPAASTIVRPQPIRHWIGAPNRLWGRIGRDQLGLVINTADPYSVQVGEYYIKVRGISAGQVLRLSMPVKPELNEAEFDELSQRIQSHFGESTQALALSWVQPYAVGCNSITGALALGYDPKVCQNAQTLCGPTRQSPYYNSPTVYPYTQLGMRPSMLLAASSVKDAQAMIDRGALSDGSLVNRSGPLAQVHFVTTSDEARSVRSAAFPPAGAVPDEGIEVHLDQGDAVKVSNRVLLYMTGRAAMDSIEGLHFLPGALADHLTSFGGRLTDPWGQMSILKWIDAGAVASYGTVSEPCAHPQKFPSPQLLLLRYLQGSSALEAYWKSVAWPQQGVFVGDPLAAPYSAR